MKTMYKGIWYKGLALIITFRKFAKAMAPLTFGKFPIPLYPNKLKMLILWADTNYSLTTVTNLVMGVSNDSVNFLNSDVASKVVSLWLIMRLK